VSISFVSKHEIGRYDTVESICDSYRISWRAITDCPANKQIRYKLPPAGKIRTGLLISIPPRAEQLVKNRLFELHRFRADVLTHFHGLFAYSEKTMLPLLGDESLSEINSDIASTLNEIDCRARAELDQLAVSASPLVQICISMSETHVSRDDDARVKYSMGDPRCGLLWAITYAKLALWTGMWERDVWEERLFRRNDRSAWDEAQQYLNTVYSLVIQEIDAKLRMDQELERTLLAESRRQATAG
jgi:hypothetical protein